MHSVGGEVATNHVASPEHFYGRKQSVAVDCQTALRSRVCPKARVVGRAYGEACHVALCLNEIFGETVEQVNLLHRIGAFARDVVEEDSERTYAKVVHHIEFVHEVLIVFLVPFDVLSWVDSPHEVNVVAATSINELLDLSGFFFWIRQAPVRAAVIWVVFWAVEIGAHLEFSVEIDERQSHLMRPRSAVETFYDAAVGQVGKVVDSHIRDVAVFGNLRSQNLAESLYAIESATLVIANDARAFFVDCESIGTR